MSHPSEPHCRTGFRTLLRKRVAPVLAGTGTLAVVLLALNVWQPGVASAPARVWIEHAGHVAGEPITISGSGFGLNENVNLTVRHDDGAAEPGMGHQSWTVLAADGTFSTTWTILPGDVGTDFFVLTAVGGMSGASDTARFGRMAVIATDKFDYGPGETALIAGSGFRAGETVTLQVSHTNQPADGAGHDPWTVTADASGRIGATWYVDPDDSLGAAFILKASGEDSHLRARWAFIDAVCPPAPPPDAVAPYVMPGQTCPTNLNSCTANDVVTSVVAAIPVDGDVCGSADDTLTLDFTVQFATTANQRYDLGFYIAKDGLSIPGHSAQVCAGAAPQVGDGDRNADTADCDTDLFLDLDHDGHLPDRDAVDTCGDLENNAGPVRMTFRATVACDHLDVNHNLLVPSCRVWEQNANHQVACTTLSQAGTGSKCDCTDLSFAGVLDPCITAYCDDGNACTADSCTNVGGAAVCHHDNVPDQTTCDDSSACTTSDVCIAGTCTGGAPPNCDDGNVCTTDSCVAATGCKHDNNTNSCDDGVFCNGSDVCANGECTHRNDECAPGQICNENPGVCVECNGDQDCHEGSPYCDTGSHTCKQCLTNAQCDDHDACNGVETCVADHCQAGAPPSCDDHNVCTTDSCVAATGCKHDNNTSSCDDGVFCNGSDVCANGECTHRNDECAPGQICNENPGVCVECNGDQDCHEGSPYCDTGSHTCKQCLTNAQCDDHDACNGVETCVADHCQAGAPPSCDDHNVCTTDSCVAATGCKHDNNTSSCDDGVFCNGSDVCANGECTHRNDECAPGQICNENPGVCVECNGDQDCHEGSPYCDTGSHTCKQCLTNAQCDDHDACNGVETCVADHCQAGAPPSCDDHNVCTTDSCVAATGCKHDNNTSSCDDGVFCNGSDVCANGECTHRNDECAPGQICNENPGVCVECNGDQDCHEGSPYCDTGSHTCKQCLTNAQCDDHDACNGVETCVADHCQAGAPPSCDDHNVCTTDSCVAATGCKHDNNTSSCDDGVFCNGSDVCANGECTHRNDECAPGQICNENPGVCVECNGDGDCDGGRVCNTGNHTCVQCLTAAQCDDHNACNGIETCVADHCQAGAPPSCDDHNVCTTDSCVAATGCKHDNNTSSCDDGVFCNGSDVCANGECTHRNDECAPGQICNENPGVCVECNSNGDCHAGEPLCDTGTHTCVQCLTDAQCDDHNACNGGESCVANQCQAGNAPNCNDGNGCTDDLCSPSSGCYHTNNANACDDGNACTTGDHCGGGNCNGGAPPSCNDNNPCTADSCNPSSGCTHTTTGDGQDGSCENVTDTSFCPLPPDNTCGAGTFRLIDLQNPTAGASGSIVQNDYLLNASNPGQWYYNVFYSGTPGSSFNLTVDIPWPFITNGDNPIQVHDGTSFSGACYVPNPSLSGFVITTDAGHVSNSGKAVILLADYKMQNLGDTQAVYVSGTVPATGLAYVTIHLDYGVKKVSGWQQNTTTLQGPDVDLNGSPDGLGDGPIFIKGGTPACTNGQDYHFDFNGGGPTLGTTIYSTNTFKKNPGVNGMLTKTTGDPKSNIRVEFYGSNNKLISAVNTDADGFYMFAYKHTGKAAVYTVKVPSLGLQKSVTLKANGYALLSFENVP